MGLFADLNEEDFGEIHSPIGRCVKLSLGIGMSLPKDTVWPQQALTVRLLKSLSKRLQ